MLAMLKINTRKAAPTTSAAEREGEPHCMFERSWRHERRSGGDLEGGREVCEPS